MDDNTSKEDQENDNVSNSDENETLETNDETTKKVGKTKTTGPSKLSTGAIAGIVVSIIVVIVIVVVVAVLFSGTSSTSSGTASSSINSSSSGSSGSSSGSTSASSSFGIPTNTQQIVSTNVVGVPSPPFPGNTLIDGPFTLVIPPSETSVVFFVCNNDPDALPVRMTGLRYVGGDELLVRSSGNSGVNTVTLALLGYSLRTGFSILPQDPFVPFCSSYVITLPGTFSTGIQLGIPFTLAENFSDYVSFVQNADVVANGAIVFGTQVITRTQVQVAYNAGTGGQPCRFNLIVTRIRTASGSTGPVLYAENINLTVTPGTTFVNYTLASSVTNPSGTIQWFAQGGRADRFSEVQGIEQISATEVRLLVTTITTSINVSIIAFRSTPPISSQPFTF